MSDSDKRMEAGLVYALPPLRQPPRMDLALVLTWMCFLSLVGLAVLAIWLFIPPWQIRLAGNQAQGTAVHVLDCGADDNGDETFLTVFRFRDAQGQLYEVPPGDDCNDLYQNGDPVSLWYLPSDPNRMLSDWDIVGLSILTPLLLIAVLGCGWLFWKAVRYFIRQCVQAKTFTHLWSPVLAALLLLALLVLAVTVAPPQPRSSGGPVRDYQSGETVLVANRWSVTVQGGQRVQVGLSRAPRAGDVCLELDLSLRNLTNRALSFSPDQFALYGPQVQAIHTACQVDTPTLSNVRLLPGTMIEGERVYEVSASFRQFYLAFQPDPQNEASRLFWRLQVTLAARQHQVGEAVPVDGLWSATLRQVQANPASKEERPAPGETCLAFEVILHNSSGQVLNQSAEQFRLYDAQGVALDTPCGLAAPRFDGTTAPGSSTDAFVGFTIPSGEQQFFLAFRPSDCAGRCQPVIWEIRVG